MRRNALGVYDLPLWKDWLAWLTALSFLAIVVSPDLRPTPLDLVIGLGFQLLLFGILPGSIRLHLRRRRQDR